MHTQGINESLVYIYLREWKYKSHVIDYYLCKRSNEIKQLYQFKKHTENIRNKETWWIWWEIINKKSLHAYV